MFVHDLLGQRLLETNGRDHALQVSNVRQFLVQLLHLVVQLFDLIESHGALVQVNVVLHIPVNLLELRFILLLVEGLVDEFELLQLLFDRVQLGGLLVLSHDKSDDCLDEEVNEEEPNGTK